MKVELAPTIVRVLGRDGTTAGTGFVLTQDGLIATCAHVVKGAEAGPGMTLQVVLHDAQVERAAQVEPGFWREPNAEDVAILRLLDSPRELTRPVDLGTSYGTDDHSVKTFGFPKVKSDTGLPGKGEVTGTTTEGGFRVLTVRSPEITPGFSGAPLFDVHTGRVIGMVASITPPDEYLRQGLTSFAIPTETLKDICPALQLSDICPYRGLNAFDQDNARFFFGRDAAVVRILNKLRHAQSFLAVLGPSGSGKSSLVQAGLIHALSQGSIAGSEHWGIVVSRPADNPFQQLLLQGLLESTSDTLTGAVRRWLTRNATHTRLVLVIDQCEELFTSCAAAVTQSFAGQLTQLLEAVGPVTIILTMRDEFYSHFTQQIPTLVEWLERGTVNVPSTLTSDQLAQIVQGPAALVGLKFEPGLIETIVRDATEVLPNEEGERIARSTSLPLLEFALTQLWEQRIDGYLTHASYTNRVGGVTGGLTNWADREYRSIEESQRPLGLRILTDLVHLGNEHLGIPDTRRSRPLSSLTRNEDERAAIQHIVDRLIKTRLLVSSGDTVEIIHDALIKEWGLLKARLQKDRRFLAWRQETESRVNGWVSTAPNDVSRRDVGKLLRGGDLNEAEGWLAERRDDLGKPERAFVEASVALREREAAEQAAQRQREIERTLELEDALERANKELAVSESQRLAFASRVLGTSEPETALLLACEAVRWDHNPLSEEVLRDALDNVTWQVKGFAGHLKAVHTAIFSSDGRHILTASDDATARLWDRNGHCLVTYRGDMGPVTSACFSPDATQILTTSRDGTGGLWSLDGHLLITLQPTAKRRFHTASGVFNHAGTHILVCTEDEAWMWGADGQLCPLNWDARPQLKAYRTEWLKARSGAEDPYRRAESEGHTARIYSAVFSPDGQRVVTASEDNTARVWDLTGRQLAILRGHDDQVINAVFSPPDGQWILTGSLDKTARLWTASGEPVAVLEGHTADVRHLAFSPDGQLLLTAVDGGGVHDVVVRLWNRSGAQIAALEGHSSTSWIKQVAFSPDGQTILTASSDKTARLWDIEGHALAVFRGHLGTIWSAAFSPDGESIVTASEDRSVRHWQSARSVLPTIVGHMEGVASAVYSADQTHILTSSRSTTGLWRASGRCRTTYDGSASLLIDHVVSPDGKYLLTTEHDKLQVHVHEFPHGLGWFDSCVGNDSGESEPTLTTRPIGAPHGWREYLDAPLATIDLSADAVGSVGTTKTVFSAEGTRVLTLAGGSCSLWDCVGELVAKLSGPNLNPREELSVDFAVFSPDGQRVVTGSINGSVWLWTKDGQLIASFLPDASSKGDNLFSLVFSPDGRSILTTIRRSADLWDLSGRHVVSLPCETNKVKRGLFSPKGDRILTVAEAALPDVRLWNSDGHLLASLDVTGGEFAPIAFDREGTRLCIVDGNLIKVWDQDGSMLAMLAGARGTWFKHVDFGADGRSLLTASSEGLAQVWMIGDGGILRSTFKGHKAEVNSAVFSADGRRVLTASSDGTARQFLVHIADLLAAAASRVGRQLDAEEIARFHIQTPLRFDASALWAGPSISQRQPGA